MRIKKQQPIDHEVLSYLNSPNVWTEAVERSWLSELDKLSASEIYQMFPPMKKPRHLKKKGKNNAG